MERTFFTSQPACEESAEYSFSASSPIQCTTVDCAESLFQSCLSFQTHDVACIASSTE
ncbi:MAG: hypothetical protein HY861_03385 [Chlamydiia bacterium]|nr:hypothetical protein [Chlamydiia bacterium]